MTVVVNALACHRTGTLSHMPRNGGVGGAPRGMKLARRHRAPSQHLQAHGNVPRLSFAVFIVHSPPSIKVRQL